jgi:hypothetical protein
MPRFIDAISASVTSWSCTAWGGNQVDSQRRGEPRPNADDNVKRDAKGRGRKNYLGFKGRVAHPEGLKEVGKGQSQVKAGAGLSGFGVSFQHEGLCHLTQGFFNGLGSNLPTFPKESSTSPGGKAHE